MKVDDIILAIKNGRTALGIEIGSTRIKAVLVNDTCEILSSGSHKWENQFKKGIWTYGLDNVWKGIQDCYSQIASDVQERYRISIKQIGSVGVSAMMHGYLAFDANGKQLAEFRTWRNNMTSEAADFLTEQFNFNIPQRWSIAHLYQAVLNNEPHLEKLDFLTTLAGYVHWKLSGQKVLGIGDASGMFPIDEALGNYDGRKNKIFNDLEAVKKYSWRLEKILPQVLRAGENAGLLTSEGAKLLDVGGNLRAGAMMAPPEGDAGTGMVSTNSVKKHTGNISVGTSAFSMNVLAEPLKNVHRDIDIVTTPDGVSVAMVHANNCSSDLNAWVQLFDEFAQITGNNLETDRLYEILFNHSKLADRDAGGLINYACLSGENITKVEKGRPLFVRPATGKMNLANFMLAQLYSAFAPLKIGMDILIGEGVKTDVMIAQGGLFKTPTVGQQILADTLEIPITVMNNAGEGGAWGMAVLAVFAKWNDDNKNLGDFLAEKVFNRVQCSKLFPNDRGVNGCQKFITRYKKGLSVEIEAGRVLTD